MNQNFILDQVKWHTQTSGNTESKERIHWRFKSIINFLQKEQLTTREILKDGQIINDDTCIQKSDLTEDGYSIMKASYDKWLKAVSKGKSPDDLKLFEKELMKIRG